VVGAEGVGADVQAALAELERVAQLALRRAAVGEILEERRERCVVRRAGRLADAERVPPEALCRPLVPERLLQRRETR
jgi:hypothetical protein